MEKFDISADEMIEVYIEFRKKDLDKDQIEILRKILYQIVEEEPK